MIVLFTDFGLRGPYVGQVHAVFGRAGDAPPVIDLMHDAPAFDPHAAGHLLAALADGFPAGTVFEGVIDPGVGTSRAPVAVEADGRWYVGPDNGLFDVVSARAAAARWWRITRASDTGFATFDGRDLFAPVALSLARGEAVPGEPMDAPHAANAGDERAEIVYVDEYGNAMTGLRTPAPGRLQVRGHRLPGGRTFADAAPGEALWLVNSIGLVEIAVNRGNAAVQLGLEPGMPVAWVD